MDVQTLFDEFLGSQVRIIVAIGASELGRVLEREADLAVRDSKENNAVHIAS